MRVTRFPKLMKPEMRNVVVDSPEVIVAHGTVESAVQKALTDVVESAGTGASSVSLVSVTEIAEGTVAELTALQGTMVGSENSTCCSHGC